MRRRGGIVAPKKIPVQEALLQYGAYALFYSVDSILGSKGQRDPMREYPNKPE
jgi:hypothetical protein